MPTFPTKGPVTVDLEVAAGEVRLVADDSEEVSVEVRPSDATRSADVTAAEQTRVDFRDGRLLVKTPMPWIMLGRRGSVDIDVHVPSGSQLEAAVAAARLHADGHYGACRLSTASGDISIDGVTGKLKADSASGDITIKRADGSIAVSTASGDAGVGELTGDLRFQTASGALTVDRLDGEVKTQSASGSVTVAAAVRGSLTVQTASGDVVVGVAEGTAAKLDLRTRSGAITNTLESADGPADGDQRLTVRAHAASGDLSVRRAATAAR